MWTRPVRLSVTHHPLRRAALATLVMLAWLGARPAWSGEQFDWRFAGPMGWRGGMVQRIRRYGPREGEPEPQQAFPWKMRLFLQERFELTTQKRLAVSRADPVVVTPVGAFGARLELACGERRIAPLQQNVLTLTEPLPWRRFTFDKWGVWYGIAAPPESSWSAGAIVGFWGGDGKTDKMGEVGSHRMHARGPFFYVHAYRKTPWGAGEGLDLWAVKTDLDIYLVLPDYGLHQRTEHTEGQLTATVYSDTAIDVFLIAYRREQDLTYTRKNVAPGDLLPVQWSYDPVEHRVGPGIRYRYAGSPECSISVAPLYVTGESTAGYEYLTAGGMSAYEDWSGAGKLTELHLQDSYGLECVWETEEFIAGLNVLRKKGDGDDVFGSFVTVPGLGITPGVFAYEQHRDEVLIKARFRLKPRGEGKPPWYRRVTLEPAYRRVKDRSHVEVDAPALALMGRPTRVFETASGHRSEIYFLGATVEEVWIFDRLFAGYGRDRGLSENHAYVGGEVSF